MKSVVKRLVREQQAQDVVEYVLLAATISLAIMAGVGGFSARIATIYDMLYNSVSALVSG